MAVVAHFLDLINLYLKIIQKTILTAFAKHTFFSNVILNDRMAIRCILSACSLRDSSQNSDDKQTDRRALVESKATCLKFDRLG